MPTYDAASYDPPAPVAHVTLRDIGTGTLLPNVVLLLDTGADVTLLPRGAVERLGVVPLTGPEYDLMGFDGQRASARAAQLDVVFLGKAFHGRYLLIDAKHGILGRDVLNSTTLVFDGPGQTWSEPQIPRP